jgi:hypothetical protein
MLLCDADIVPVVLGGRGEVLDVGRAMRTATPAIRRAVTARDKGCAVQVGTDMLFEMIPAYLEFFGFGTATADALRAEAKISY